MTDHCIPKVSNCKKKHRYKCLISYDGTHYSGWQVQPNRMTIQSQIQDVLKKILGKSTHLTGSGRTDAGVHARAQVGHFDTDEPIEPLKILRALNGLLPQDIRILEITQTTHDFHARFSAKEKTYHYNLSLGPACDPLMRLYSYHLFYNLDLEKLREGLALFEGTHDFASFTNSANHGAAANGTVRTLTACRLLETPFGLTISITGTGFLYKMVRNIVGTLLRVATHKLPVATITELFKVKDRRKAPMAAPAKGLILSEVIYS